MCLKIVQPNTKAGRLRYEAIYKLIAGKKRYREEVMRFARVAKKDIRVFKVLDSSMYPPYYNARKYEYDVLNKSRFGFSFDNYNITIESGLHSFGNLERAKIFKDDRDTDWRTHNIHRVIIPKGATYFVGLREELVSDQLIIKSVIKPK